MSTYETLIVEKKDRIAKITLNRPHALNAYNIQMKHELHEAFAEVEQDDEVDVVIITGAGRKAFCAGRDLKEVGQTLESLGEYPSADDHLLQMSKPTIAAVNGYAITGGFELALCCDIVIAADNARFADTHARVGIIPGAGMTQILPRLVGMKKALELSFTGNYISADEAQRIGLVNKVVPADELQEAAEALARDILSCDQSVVRKIKMLAQRGEGQSLEIAMMMERFVQILHLQQMSAADVEGRRRQVVERGRAQAT